MGGRGRPGCVAPRVGGADAGAPTGAGSPDVSQVAHSRRGRRRAHRRRSTTRQRKRNIRSTL
eukprot:2048123-Pyramimonas_sp.AAC.1